MQRIFLQIKVGDKFYSTIKTAVKDKNGKPFRTSVQGVFTVTDRNNEQITVETADKIIIQITSHRTGEYT